MEPKNCLTCRHVREKDSETGREVWYCPLNEMDVNRRMSCDGWDNPSWERLAEEVERGEMGNEK